MATAGRGELLWTPEEEVVQNATLTRFAASAGHDDYDSLWRWSVEDLEGFWGAVWDFFGVKGSYSSVLGKRGMPGTEWFPGAKLNYAEHVFRDFDPAATAIRARSETRGTETMTWAELERGVSRARAGLAELGVGRGDRVVAYMPNIPETVIAFLATASLGATWSSAAPEFGARSVIDRFAQIEPKVLLAVDGYRYGGKDFEKIEAVNSMRAAMPTLEQTVILPYLSGAGRVRERAHLGPAARVQLEPRVRERALRSPAVGALFLGHHRPAEGHRPGARRHPARAPQEDAPPLQPAAGRPLLLVHDYRLDDVELPHRRPAREGRDHALRRQSGLPGHERVVGLRARLGDELLRHERELHRGLHEGRDLPARDARPERAAERRLHRLAAVPRGLRLGVRAREGGRVAVLDQRWHGRLHGVRRGRADPARAPRRAAGAGARGEGRSVQ